MKKVRIFVTTSHISTVFMVLMARETNNGEYDDFLLLDSGERRKDQINLILEAATLHNWKGVKSFSIEVEPGFDFKPSRRQKLVRQTKGSLLFGWGYKILLENFLRKQDKIYSGTILKLIEENHGKNPEVSELILMSQTHLGRPLQKMFPNSPVNFTEHGIGDYYFLSNDKIPEGKMYALFCEQFKIFLEKNNTPNNWVFPIPGIETFETISKKLLELHEPHLALAKLDIPQKPIVFVALEAVHMYNVSDNFWTDYINHIWENLDAPSAYHYILKTHPLQTPESILKTKNHFLKRGITFTLLDSPISAEVVFYQWKNQVKHVFCLFSSGCFYISQLYTNNKIKFYYSTEFMSKYISNAPPQFHKLFIEIRPMIEQVFAEKCVPY